MFKNQICLVLLFFLMMHSCDYVENEAIKIQDKEIKAVPDLVQLCKEYGTDKCADSHNFIAFYNNLFSPIRDSVSRVFEIGIMNAQSHLLWKEYFMNAEVFGMDINDCSRFESQGIKTYVGDQSDRVDLKGFISKYSEPFDIIIDDGGHHMDQQQISFGFLFPFVMPGGYYIIEDLHTSIPLYYNSKYGFGVNDVKNNTTLQVIESYLMNNSISSLYMTEEEKKYLNDHIDFITIYRRNNVMRSMMCVIKKKL